MPTYDYECGVCGHTCEIFQSITEAPKRRCPACGRSSFKRMIGAGAGVIFKGTGFYETDYRSADYKEKAKADSETGSSKKSAESSGEPKKTSSSSTSSKKDTTSDSSQ